MGGGQAGPLLSAFEDWALYPNAGPKVRIDTPIVLSRALHAGGHVAQSRKGGTVWFWFSSAWNSTQAEACATYPYRISALSTDRRRCGSRSVPRSRAHLAR